MQVNLILEGINVWGFKCMHATGKCLLKNSFIAKVRCHCTDKQHNKCFNKIKIKYVLSKPANDLDLVTFTSQKKALEISRYSKTTTL